MNRVNVLDDEDEKVFGFWVPLRFRKRNKIERDFKPINILNLAYDNLRVDN